VTLWTSKKTTEEEKNLSHPQEEEEKIVLEGGRGALYGASKKDGRVEHSSRENAEKERTAEKETATRWSGKPPINDVWQEARLKKTSLPGEVGATGAAALLPEGDEAERGSETGGRPYARTEVRPRKAYVKEGRRSQRENSSPGCSLLFHKASGRWVGRCGEETFLRNRTIRKELSLYGHVTFSSKGPRRERKRKNRNNKEN